MSMSNNKSNKGISSDGSIVFVGVGMTLGSHLSPLARSYIEEADIVFVLVSDGIVEQWICEMNKNVKSLQIYYREGCSRIESYQQMVEVMMDNISQGLKVVGAFYGHPGVFACVSHQVIQQAKSQGFYARMEPGISAEDCLYADLGLDPGEFGCTHFETSQFMFYQRQIDTSAYLILWQIGIAGDTSLSKFSTDSAYRKILIQLLNEHYPRQHQVILYEAPTLPIHQARIDYLPLAELVTAQINQQTTLVIPPCNKMTLNQEVYEQLSTLSKKHNFLQLV